MAVAGEPASPSTKLVKTFFDKLSLPEWGGFFLECTAPARTPFSGPAVRRRKLRPLSAGTTVPTRVGNADTSFSSKSRKTEEISRFNLWRLISCSVRRQLVAVGTADRRQLVAVGTADRR